MTRRERLERKLELRREWAGKRTADSAARFKAARDATEHIPFGQPILIGHHSEKRHRAALARSDAHMRAGVESAEMADHHESRAEGIEAQLESSVFSDDPDAIEQLQAKIAEAEAFQSRIKDDNRKLRKAKISPDDPEWESKLQALQLDPWTMQELVTLRRVCRYHVTPIMVLPGYALSNRGANIRRMKQRVEEIGRRQRRSALAEQSGGVLIEGTDWVRVTFSEKPARSVLDAIKAAGFYWSAGSWCGERSKLPECVTQ